MALLVAAVGMWESRSDFQGAVGTEENLLSVFLSVHSPVISTAVFFTPFSSVELR
jgi:hypothetical protein